LKKKLFLSEERERNASALALAFKKCGLVWKSAHFEALSGKLRASTRFSERCPTLLERFVLEPADLPIDFSSILGGQLPSEDTLIRPWYSSHILK
jgi:hypothetical protein